MRLVCRAAWVVGFLTAAVLISGKPVVTAAQGPFPEGTFIFEDFDDVQDWQLISGTGTITAQDGVGIVEGDATGGKQLWTVFGRRLEFDIRVTPILEVKVDDVTDRWFIYLQPDSGELLVVKMDVPDIGTIRVDLRNIRVDAGGRSWNWPDRFKGVMLIGVSGPSATLKYAVFDHIVFEPVEE